MADGEDISKKKTLSWADDEGSDSENPPTPTIIEPKGEDNDGTSADLFKPRDATTRRSKSLLPALSTSPPPPTIIEPMGEDNDGTSADLLKPRGALPKRSKSPLPAPFILNVRAQMGWLTTISNPLSARSDESMDQTHPFLLDELLQQLQSTYQEFLKVHAKLESTCTQRMLENEYFIKDVRQQEAATYSKAILKVTAHKVRLNSSQPPKATRGKRSRPRLPEIPLPKFDGTYSQWPKFKELYTSLILNVPRMSDVEKLHYLRGGLSGNPAKLISGMPLTKDSLMPS